MKYLSFVILLASSFTALASAVNEDMGISRHRDLEIDEPFKLLFDITHKSFDPDKEWCLSAKRDGKGSLIRVRECKQFDEDQVNLQLWERYKNNQLKLSDSSRNLCLRARHRRVYLHTCKENPDYRNSFVVNENSSVVEHENGDDIKFLLGLRKSNVMGRILLMQANTRSIVGNDTLTWNVRYVSQTSAPTSSPTNSPTSSPSKYPSFSPSIKSPTPQGRSIPVSSPGESPTMCEDDPDYEFEIVNISSGNKRIEDCAWLTANSNPERDQIRTDRFCKFQQVKDNCKKTCGSC